MKLRKLLIYTALMWALVLPLNSQAVAPVSSGIFVMPEVQLFDDAGEVCGGCLLYTYVAGTSSTNRPTYTTRQLNVANLNPVELDSAGRAEIYLKSDNAYKFKLMDATASTTYWTIDNVTGAGSHYIGDIDGDTLVEVEATADVDTITLTVQGNTKLTIGPKMDFWKGIIRRSKFIYNDANTIEIEPGLYFVKQILVFWDVKVTSADIGTPSTSTWVYLYLDFSDIGLESREINAANFLTMADWSEIPPIWDATLHGWYNGQDLCIFAVYSDGSSNITEFFHDGGDFVVYADDILQRSDANLDQAGADVTLTIPTFSIRAAITFYHAYGDSSTGGKWKTYGQTASTGHITGFVTAGTTVSTNTLDVITSSDQKIHVWHTTDGTDTQAMYTVGWYFPLGM